MKKISLFVLALVIIFSTSTQAAVNPDYKAAVLMELQTGRVIFEHNMNMPLPQASITKLMTYYTFMDFIKNNNINLNDEVVIESKFNLPPDGTGLNLKRGDRLSINQLINTMLIISANDSASEAAYYYDKHAKTKQKFIQIMNANAKNMGLFNSHYINVTGLTIRNGSSRRYNITTAYETAQLAANVIKKYPQILGITSKSKYTYKGKVLTNTNKLLGVKELVDGLKTGHTNEAGYCVVTTENVSGKIGNGQRMRFIAVVLGSKTDHDRFIEASKLLKYGETNFINERVIDKEKALKIQNEFYTLGYISAYPAESAYYLKNKAEKLSSTVELNKNLPSMIKKSAKIGKVVIRNNKAQVIAEEDLFASNDFKQVSFAKRTIIQIRRLIMNIISKTKK